MCIGDSFAKLVAALVLAVLAQRWRLTTASEAEVLPAAGVTLAPERPILLCPALRLRAAYRIIDPARQVS
jgi:cytochrome P450